ncbi:hypothetical protein PIB30_020118 [Stylosanthes scabra]|uniref:Uncharacterized protein n=1 Tax=Stylosanthes scabra TaxID=79078 RepID=A0ABU6X5V2_9FABA|nr:hypothetical protein [Stylosanthes scabra]
MHCALTATLGSYLRSNLDSYTAQCRILPLRSDFVKLPLFLESVISVGDTKIGPSSAGQDKTEPTSFVPSLRRYQEEANLSDLLNTARAAAAAGIVSLLHLYSIQILRCRLRAAASVSARSRRCHPPSTPPIWCWSVSSSRIKAESTTLSIIAKYKTKFSPAFGFTNIGGLARYCLNCWNAFSYSSSHV